MKVWTITVLLIILICLTIPFVTADDKKGDIGKIKKTPATVEIKPVDSLAYVKKAIGMNANTDVEIHINGKWQATIPDDSPIKNVQITQECINQYPYGTLQWYRCEVS